MPNEILLILDFLDYTSHRFRKTANRIVIYQRQHCHESP